MTYHFSRCSRLVIAFLSVHLHILPQASDHKNFQSQYQRELKLAKQNVPLDKGFPNNIPKKRNLSITIKDAFVLALQGNQTILDSVAAYKQAVLNYQETMFQYQFSAGTLSYTHTHDVEDHTNDSDLSLTVSQTYPFGLTYSISEDVTGGSDSSSQSTDISFTQSVYGPTRSENRNTIQSAREQLANAKNALRDSVSSALKAVAEEFRTILFSQESLVTIRESLRSVESNLDRANILMKMGSISKNELDIVRVQEINTKLSIQQQEFTLRETKNKLKINLGLSTSDEITLRPHIDSNVASQKLIERILDKQPLHKKSMLFDALTKSSTLIGMRYTLNSNQRAIETAERSNGVTVDLTGTADFSSSESTSKTLGMSLSYPLDKRSNNNSIQSNSISTKLGRKEFLNTCLGIFRQESDNYNNILYQYERVKLTQQQLDSSKNIDGASKIRFKYGAISATDVQQNHDNYLESIRNLRQSENTYASTLDNYRVLTNRYLENLPVPLTFDLDLIFQTSPAEDRLRSLKVPQIIISSDNFDPDNPYKTCQDLMQAKIANM